MSATTPIAIGQVPAVIAPPTPEEPNQLSSSWVNHSVSGGTEYHSIKRKYFDRLNVQTPVYSAYATSLPVNSRFESYMPSSTVSIGANKLNGGSSSSSKIVRTPSVIAKGKIETNPVKQQEPDSPLRNRSKSMGQHEKGIVAPLPVPTSISTIEFRGLHNSPKQHHGANAHFTFEEEDDAAVKLSRHQSDESFPSSDSERESDKDERPRSDDDDDGLEFIPPHLLVGESSFSVHQWRRKMHAPRI